jgi:hypothetical protein
MAADASTHRPGKILHRRYDYLLFISYVTFEAPRFFYAFTQLLLA